MLILSHGNLDEIKSLNYIDFLLIGSHWKLITITEKEFVGYLPNGVEVFCIKKITAIPLTNDNIDLSILELEVSFK